MEKKYLEEISVCFESCLEIARQTRTLQLLKVLPTKLDLEKLKGLVEGLLELHDFYKSCLLSWKYSGEPLSEEEIAAMKEAGIDPNVEEKVNLKLTKREGVSLDMIRSLNERRGEGP